MKVIFGDGEYCPHCEKSKYHHRQTTNVHPCEFCHRIDAVGECTMDGEFYLRAVKNNWKEMAILESRNENRKI